ncbi:adenosylcobinamide-phosphate synthase CbiB [Rhodoferax sp. U2-2l]|uniref:adenosylcobinamide-phosphate synthase CbiB n=1 Tax=Rhodoferax sp. U2-2l TaxID=2884000 RepID=UPI001D09B0D5|nr:adenosylcobinamide-phosphate synthase CbiB [Rhodoferax sp. U2-2l]MCB8746488.1 adenosylcobinamide-phosphate synthase CbiB [Rhodoferax sp. U2-2l]
MSLSVAMAALLLALLIDRLWGEPPVRLHPVVWMGNYLGWAGQRLQRGVRAATSAPRWQPSAGPLADAVGAADYRSFAFGVLYWVGGVTLFTVVAWWLEQGLGLAGQWAAAGVMGGPGIAGGEAADGLATGLTAVLLALLLKPMLAWAMLQSEVQAVEAALQQSLSAGRERLGWLVSRDTATLSEAQVRESAIESLAENLNDSVVAPIFWFVLLGLPGAVAYRFANTADAMWGYKGVYKGQNWEWAGKWAARVDDVLNWLPARLTGLLLVLIGGIKMADLRREAIKTPSPNSGWPMAAMALALGIRLGKPGVYVLNPAGGEPLAARTQQAIVCASRALLALVPLALVGLVLKAWLTP